MEWEGYVRCETSWHDDEFVDLVAQAGFRKGYFGLEILPSEKRSALQKRDDVDPEILLERCRSADVKVHLFCMFGFPGTDHEDAKRTIDFLLSNRDSIDTADVFPWTYAKHTHVTGAEPINTSDRDWALEFAHRPTAAGVLSSEAVIELASHYEEMIWETVPRFLHPVYRLVSPWTNASDRIPPMANGGLADAAKLTRSPWQLPHSSY